jgi:hypothetical protein
MELRPSYSPEGQRIFPGLPTFKQKAAEQSELAWVSLKSGRLRILSVGGADLSTGTSVSLTVSGQRSRFTGGEGACNQRNSERLYFSLISSIMRRSGFDAYWYGPKEL